MKLFGNKLFIFFSFTLLIACNTQYLKAIRSRNKIGNDIYTFYKNDSLKISIQFFGDYEPINLKDTSYNKHLYKLSEILNSGFKTVKKNELLSLETNIEPWFQTSLVVSNKVFVNSKKWKNLNILGRDFREMNLKFENYDVRIIDLQYNIKKRPLLWMTWLNETENRTNTLIEETDTILRSIKFGNNYSSFIPPNPFLEADKAFKSDLEAGGNYLSPLLKLKSIENYYSTTQINNFFSQALGTYQSFIGIENKNIFTGTEKTIASLKVIPFLRNNDAKDALIKKIGNNQVVMFNEAHIFPCQRYLVSSLLDTLYKLNFRVLALEALEKEPNQDKIYPNLQTGFYVREPQMANLIRNAKSLGFRVVSYEDTLENSKDREITQAQNLFKSSLKNNPNEKIIVLAGGQHIEVNTPPNGKRWMASYFKEMTGINPLSINQTSFDSQPFSNDELIFFEGHDITNKLGTAYSHDVYLINHIKPQSFKIKPGVPDCSLKINLKFDSTKRIENQLAVMVYYSSEFIENYKIPVYTTLIAKKEEHLELKLPAGGYYVVLKNSIGQSLFKEKYTIGEGCKIN